MGNGEKSLVRRCQVFAKLTSENLKGKFDEGPSSIELDNGRKYKIFTSSTDGTFAVIAENQIRRAIIETQGKYDIYTSTSKIEGS